MSEYGTLFDANTGEPIGPATREQWMASTTSPEPTGFILVDKDLEPCDAGVDASVYGPFRTVYVLGGPSMDHDNEV